MRTEKPQITVRVHVWEWPVCAAHWAIFFSVAVLSITGYYIGRPFLISSGPASSRFVMGTVKVIHSYAAIVFSLAVFSRITWMFIGNKYARWNQFLPVSAERRRGFWDTLKFYFFLSRHPPSSPGHNPLAGATYTVVFALYLLQIATGFGLYAVSSNLHSPMRPFAVLLGIFGGAQSARWLHHAIMWLLLAFVVHHLFSALQWSRSEKDGTFDSIFTGYKIVPPERAGSPEARRSS
jgi:Ni/Fe-hydrogenase 1 B-type cytochrome subunit